jgi:hypothetical protein
MQALPAGEAGRTSLHSGGDTDGSCRARGLASRPTRTTLGAFYAYLTDSANGSPLWYVGYVLAPVLIGMAVLSLWR